MRYKKIKVKKKVIILISIFLIFLIYIVLINYNKIQNLANLIKIQMYGEPIEKETGIINNEFFSINQDGKDSKNTTKGINEAIQYASKNNIEYIQLRKGTYLIDGNTTNYCNFENAEKKGIILESNITLDLNGSLIKHVSTSYPNYSIFSITDVENVEIRNGFIVGDKYTHDYSNSSTHEWGFGIDIRGSKNVNINNVQISETTGDGIILGDYTNGDYAENISIRNCKISDCRRQGISIVCAENVCVQDNEINNINGTNPQSSIDIEPIWPLQHVKNVVIKNNIFYNNASGIAVAFSGDSQDVSIINNKMTNAGIGCSNFNGNANIGYNNIIDATLWIYGQVITSNTRNEKISIYNNQIKNSEVLIGNIANVVLFNNNIQEKGIRITASNIAISNNIFSTTKQNNYAIEYFGENGASKNYICYINGNSYNGNFYINEKIDNLQNLKITDSKEETESYIKNLIGEELWNQINQE